MQKLPDVTYLLLDQALHKKMITAAPQGGLN